MVLLTLLVSLSTCPALAQLATRPSTVPATDFPTIQLDVQDPITADKPVPCIARLLPSTTNQPEQVGPWQATIHVRGSTSQSYPKKSFALTLDSPAAPLNLPMRKHWILNAAYIDRSLMRHKLAYDLFRSLSMPTHPRYAAASRFVEVYLNGAYRGVYLLMERVDRNLLRFDPDVAGAPAPACLYKAVNHAADFLHPGHSGYEQQDPDPAVLAYWQPLDALNQFIHAASPAAFFHPETGIAAHFDLDNAIDFHLLILVTANTDGITKNFYLARPQPQTGVPTRFFFVPWDYDGTFGQNWDSTPLALTGWLSNHLLDRLLQKPDYRRRFIARWNQLRDNEFSVQTIQAMIATNAQELHAAALRNAARWPTNRPPFRNRLSFDQDVAQMTTWIAARIAWLDQAIRQRVGSADKSQ